MSLLRLKDLDLIPPDGLRYTHPETGHISRGPDYKTWLANAKAHLRERNLPVPENLLEIMQDQLCQLIPPEQCDRAPDAAWVNTRFNFDDVVNGAKTLAAWAQDGGQFVSDEEATRRARICAGCYLNVHVSGCGLCHQMAKLVTHAVGARNTEHDHLLRACAVCHCANKVQVHFPMDVLEKGDTPEKQEKYPVAFCWKSKQSPTYVPMAQESVLETG